MKYLMFFLTLSLSSCTKLGKNVTIEGRVLNPITGEGIPDVEIWLQKTTNGLPGGMKTIKKVKSNVNGDYELNKFSLSASSAVCALSADYYPIGWKNNKTGEALGNPTLTIKKGKTIHADFYAVSYGNMKYTIKNISCFDEFDTLLINRKYQISSVPLFNDNTSTYTGCYEYVGQVFSKYPMGWHYIEGYYKKNNVVVPFSDSIYIAKDGYHEWIFEY